MRILGQARPAPRARDKENENVNPASAVALKSSRSPRDVEISPFQRVQEAGSQQAHPRPYKNTFSVQGQVQAQVLEPASTPTREANNRSSSTPRVLSAKRFSKADASSANSGASNSHRSPFKHHDDGQGASRTAPAPAPRRPERQVPRRLSDTPAESDEGIRASKVLSVVIERALNHENLGGDGLAGESTLPIQVVTCDKQTITISRDIAMKSLTLKWKAAHETGKVKGGDTVWLTDESCTREMLMKITRYLAVLSSAENGHAPLGSLLAAEDEVAGSSEADVFKLLMAANYLEMPELTSIACERLQKVTGQHQRDQGVRAARPASPNLFEAAYPPVPNLQALDEECQPVPDLQAFDGEVPQVPNLQANVSDATSVSASSIPSTSFNLSQSFNSTSDHDDSAVKITADLVLSVNPLESMFLPAHLAALGNGRTSNPLGTAFPLRYGENTRAGGAVEPAGGRGVHQETYNPLESAFPLRASQAASSESKNAPARIGSYTEVQMPSQAPYEPAPINIRNPYVFGPPRSGSTSTPTKADSCERRGDFVSSMATPPRAALKAAPSAGGDLAMHIATPPRFVSVAIAKLNAKAEVKEDAAAPTVPRGAHVELRARAAFAAATVGKQAPTRGNLEKAGQDTFASRDAKTANPARSAKKLFSSEAGLADPMSAEPPSYKNAINTARSKLVHGAQHQHQPTQERTSTQDTAPASGAEMHNGLVWKLAQAFSGQTASQSRERIDGHDRNDGSKSSSALCDNTGDNQRQDQRGYQQTNGSKENSNDRAGREDDQGHSQRRGGDNSGGSGGIGSGSGSKENNDEDGDRSNRKGGTNNKGPTSPKKDPKDQEKDSENDHEVEISQQPILASQKRSMAPIDHSQGTLLPRGDRFSTPVKAPPGAASDTWSSPFGQRVLTENDLYDIMTTVAPPPTPIQDGINMGTPTRMPKKAVSRLVDVDEGGHVDGRGRNEWMGLLDVFSGKTTLKERETNESAKNSSNSKGARMQSQQPSSGTQQLLQWENKRSTDSKPSAVSKELPDARVQSLKSLLSKTNDTLEQARANLLKLQEESMQSSPRSPSSPDRPAIEAKLADAGKTPSKTRGRLELDLQDEKRCAELAHNISASRLGGTQDQGNASLDESCLEHQKIVMPNGDVYIGTVYQDAWHGAGICKYSNGDAYTGEWKKGKRHGWGRMEWEDGNIYEGVWRHDLVCPGFKDPRPAQARAKDSPPHPTANMQPASTYMDRVHSQRLQNEGQNYFAAVIPVDTPLRNSRGRGVTGGLKESGVQGKENSSPNSTPASSPTRKLGEANARSSSWLDQASDRVDIAARNGPNGWMQGSFPAHAPQVQPKASPHALPRTSSNRPVIHGDRDGLMGVFNGFTNAVFDVGDVISDLVKITAEDGHKEWELAKKKPFVPPRLTQSDNYYMAL